MTIDYDPEKPNHSFGPLTPYRDALDTAARESNAANARDARRYRTLKRMAIQHHDADEYGYAAEAFDMDCDKQAEWFRKFDDGTLKICPNCDCAMPDGCEGKFVNDGHSCWLNHDPRLNK